MKLDELLEAENKPKYEEFILEVGQYIVHFHTEFSGCAYRALHEGRQRGNVTLSSQYSANHHSAHVKGSQEHIHVYAKHKELFTMNKNGTGKDGSSGISVPVKVAKAIKNNFPDFTIPDNRILESIKPAAELLMKFENLHGNS